MKTFLPTELENTLIRSQFTNGRYEKNFAFKLDNVCVYKFHVLENKWKLKATGICILHELAMKKKIKKVFDTDLVFSTPFTIEILNKLEKKNQSIPLQKFSFAIKQKTIFIYMGPEKIFYSLNFKNPNDHRKMSEWLKNLKNS